MEKCCSKCKVIKPITEFALRSSTKDGREYRCKTCAAVVSRAWYLKNKEKTKASTKAWIKANPEKWKGYSKKWFAKHPELRAKYQKARVLRLRAAKLCTVCGSSLMPNSEWYCQYHYIWTLARTRLKTQSPDIVAALLSQWERQGGKCYYTDAPIELGATASLDHIMPVSRFPEKQGDLSNVVWVDRDVNYAKGKLTVPEFVALCQRVVLHNSQK